MKHRPGAPRLAIAVLLAMTAATASATPCEEVISTIDSKLKTRGLTGYTLEAIPREEARNQRVVGTCDVGLKRIIYAQTAASAPAAAPTGATVAQAGSGSGTADTTVPATSAGK